MSTIIIKFVIRDTKVTWFVNDWWVLVVSFLLTLAVGRVYKRFKRANKKIKISNPKGGGFIDSCIEPDAIYELLDPGLVLASKKMLNFPPGARLSIISVPVLIMACIVLRKPLNYFRIMNTNIFIENLKVVVGKTALGIGGGIVAIVCSTIVPAVAIATALLSSALIFNSGQGIWGFDYNTFVSKVPMHQLKSVKQIGFLDIVPGKSPKIYIQGSEDVEPYVPGPDLICSGEYKQVEIRPSNVRPVTTSSQIEKNKNCRGNYVPLSKRTKTLKDLKTDDSSNIRKQTEPYIKRYKNRREQIMKTRVEL